MPATKLIRLMASSVHSSLIKMLYWMCEKSGLPPTWPQLEHAICRNFGGMESDELDTLEEFKRQIDISSTPDLQSIPQKVPCIYQRVGRLYVGIGATVQYMQYLSHR